MFCCFHYTSRHMVLVLLFVAQLNRVVCLSFSQVFDKQCHINQVYACCIIVILFTPSMDYASALHY